MKMTWSLGSAYQNNPPARILLGRDETPDLSNLQSLCAVLGCYQRAKPRVTRRRKSQTTNRAENHLRIGCSGFRKTMIAINMRLPSPSIDPLMKSASMITYLKLAYPTTLATPVV
jgi:hypothetical protein